MKLGFIGAGNMAKAMIGGKVLEFMLLQTIKRLQEQQKCSFCL